MIWWRALILPDAETIGELVYHFRYSINQFNDNFTIAAELGLLPWCYQP
jgi:hypothetical protein